MDDVQQIALVADDDEFFRMALAAVLTKSLGFSKVIETGSLDEALQCLAEHNGISLALFDLNMPGMQSAANLEVVRTCFPHIPVAVISSSDRRSDILTALEAGVHGYIPKRLGIQEVVQALRLVISGTIFVPTVLADCTKYKQTLASPAERVPDGARTPYLTPRQRDVWRLLVQGKSNKEIARALNLSPGTVKIHMAALFKNLGVTSRTSAAALGVKLLAH